MKRHFQVYWMRVALGFAFLVGAGFRLFAAPNVDQATGPAFMALLAGAAASMLLPWERIQSLKWGGVEVKLEEPGVKQALQDLATVATKATQRAGGDDAKGLLRELTKVESLLPLLEGRRILWVDDHPSLSLAERRLLRALGLEIVSAASSDAAASILENDQDFDAILSDIGRAGEDSHWKERGLVMEAGPAFAKAHLRSSDNRWISGLPVIFYSAYSDDEARELVRDVGGRVDCANDPRTLLNLVIREIALGRRTANPLQDKATTHVSEFGQPYDSPFLDRRTETAEAGPEDDEFLDRRTVVRG